MNRPLGVRLPEKFRKELAAVARERGVELSVLVREALQRLVALHKFESARSRVLPLARRAGIITDEDVFKNIRS